MILADTSVWISHLRQGHPDLIALLNQSEILCHPLVMGELACGNLHNRKMILSLLEALPTAKSATHAEVLQFIDARKLMGRGIGYVDAHLLASALLSPCLIWTLDKKLAALATKLHCAYPA